MRSHVHEKTPFNQIELDIDQYGQEAAAQIKQRMVRYASGMSAVSDFAEGAYARSGHKNYGIGVDARIISARTIEQIAHAILFWKTPIFIDSGAFGYFRQHIAGKSPKAMNFDAILNKYDRILEAISDLNVAEEMDYPRPMMVMPDVVGNQDASLSLIQRYAKAIAVDIQFNLLEPIIPIQKGRLSLSQAYDQAGSLVGSDNFTVGLPSNAQAISKLELIGFLKHSKPKKVHFLGAASDSKINPLIHIVAHNSPETCVTADASQIRFAILNGVANGRSRQQAITQALYEPGDPYTKPFFQEAQACPLNRA